MIGIKRKPGLFKDIQQRGQVTLPLRRKSNMQRTSRSMVVRLGRSVFRVDAQGQAAVESFEQFQATLDGLPGESIVTSDTSPFFIVVPRANTVHSKVDGTGTSHTQATRVIDLPVIAVWLHTRLVPPVHVLVLEGSPSLAVDTEDMVFVMASSLKQEDFRLLGSFSKSSRDGTTSWAT